MSYFCVVSLFGILILFHELGHFGAALAIGVQVETFSIGFGPRLFGVKCREIDFRLSAIPFGGYVRTVRDQSEGEKPTHLRSPQSRARWQRAVIIAAGPLMNIVLAIGVVAGIYMYGYPKQMNATDPVIVSIKAGSPAAQAGLEPGDRILELHGKQSPNWDFILMEEALYANHPLKGIVEHHGQPVRFTITPRMDLKSGVGIAGWVGEQNRQIGDVEQSSPAARAGLRRGDLLMTANGQQVLSPAMVQQAVSHSGGKPLTFQVMRNGHLKNVVITPSRTNKPKTSWRIGISFNVPVQVTKLRLGSALKESAQLNQQNALMMFQILEGIVEGRVSPKLLLGPIGMVQMVRAAAQAGARSYLFLMALMSLQLAIFNLLPIPILDGGALLMLIIEMLAQRDISPQMKEIIFTIGLVFLIMIDVFLMYSDVGRLFTGR